MPYAINVDGLGEITIPDKASDVDLLTNVLIEKYLAGQMDDTDAQIAMLDGLLEMSMNRGGRGEPLPPAEIGPPDRGYLGEAGAGIWSGAKYTLGAGLSGIERLAEQWGIDPTGTDEGWLRQAGNALKEGAEEIKASPNLPEWYFKTFNAFGSALSFMATGVAAAPLGGLPALGVMGAFAAGTGVDEALDRAEKAGVSPKQMKQIATLGFGIGLTELAAPMKILNGLRKAFRVGRNDTTKGLAATSTEQLRRKTIDGAKGETLAKNLGVDPKPFRTYGKDIAQSIGLEGSQEAIAAIAQNAVEKYMYNPDADLVNTEAFEEGLYGGAAGGMIQGILGIYGVRKSRGFRKKVDKFMDSDTYKGIDDTALKAVNTLDDPEATEEQKATATAQLQRADAMMETALRQNVFNSKEVKDYLRSQLANEVDEDGNPVYSERYIAEILDPKNEEALKDFYIRHTLNPNTKYEPEAEDIIYGTVNPVTGEEFTFTDMEELRKTKSGPELVTEVKLRKAAIDRGESREAQLSRIHARNELGIGDRRLNTVRKIFQDANKEIAEGTLEGTAWDVDAKMAEYADLITRTQAVEGGTVKEAKAKVDKSLRDNREMGLEVYAAKLNEIDKRQHTSKVKEKEDESEESVEDLLEDSIKEAEERWEKEKGVQIVPTGEKIDPNETKEEKKKRVKREADAKNRYRQQLYEERVKELGLDPDAMHPSVFTWVNQRLAAAEADLKGLPPPPSNKEQISKPTKRIKEEPFDIFDTALPQLSSAVDGDNETPQIQQADNLFIQAYNRTMDALGWTVVGQRLMEPHAVLNGLKRLNGNWENFKGEDVNNNQIRLMKLMMLGDPKMGYGEWINTTMAPFIESLDPSLQTYIVKDGNTPAEMTENFMDLWIRNPNKNEQTQKDEVDTPSPSIISPATRSYIPLDNNLFMKMGIISDKDIEDITGRMMHMVTITNPERKNWRKEGPDDYGNITYTNIDPQTNDLKEIRFVREYGPESSEKIKWVENRREELQLEVNRIEAQIKVVHDLLEQGGEEARIDAMDRNMDLRREDARRKDIESAPPGQEPLEVTGEMMFHTMQWDSVTENKFDLEELQEDLAARQHNMNTVQDRPYIGQDLGFLGTAQTGTESRLGRYVMGGKEELFSVAPETEGILTVNVGLIEYSELRKAKKTESQLMLENILGTEEEDASDFDTWSEEEQTAYVEREDDRIIERRLRKALDEKEMEKVVGVKALSQFIQTSVHEAWHFAREFVFTADQLAFFNRVVTPELALQNGWGTRRMDEYYKYYSGAWDNNVNFIAEDNIEKREKRENDALMATLKKENPEMEQHDLFRLSIGDPRNNMGSKYQEGTHEEGYFDIDSETFIVDPAWAAKRNVGKEKYMKDRIRDEAQAYMFQKWYDGVVLKGLTPRARSLMQMLRDFFVQMKNILQDVGIIKTSEQVENENAKDEGVQLKKADAERLKQEWEDFRSGKTASTVGAMHYEPAVAAVYATLPTMAPSIAESFGPLEDAFKKAKELGKKLRNTNSAIPVEEQPESGEQAGETVMKDLSNFAGIIAHVSNIAEKNILFKAVYNQVQNRVQYRNTIKMVADVLIEKVGKFNGILKLKREGLKKVLDLTILADAAGVEPVFTDIEGDNPSVTITFTSKETNEIGSMYGNLDGDVQPWWTQRNEMRLYQWNEIHDPQQDASTWGSEHGLQRLLDDAGIDFDAVTTTKGKREVQIDTQGVNPATIPFDPEWHTLDGKFYVPELRYTYTKTGEEAAAFAGTYYAGKHVGEEKYKSIVHNLLNTGSYAGIGEIIGINTGKESTYETIQKEIKDFLKKVTDFEVESGMPLKDPRTGEPILDEKGEPLYEAPIKIWTHRKGINQKAYDIYQSMYETYVAQQALKQGVSPEEATVDPHLLGKPLVNKDKIKQADNFLEILNAVAYEKRPGYFPHLRFGDKGIAVYKQKTDKEGKLLTDSVEDEASGIIKEVPRRGDMIRLETVESRAQRLLGGIPLVGDRLNRKLKEEQHGIARELRRKFPESGNFIVTEFDMTLDHLRTGKDGKAIMQAMGTIENLAAIFQGHTFDNRGEKIESKTKSDNRREDLLDSYVNFLKERTTESRAQTLLKNRKNIPGFINERNNDGDYFRVAFQRFIDSSSNVASSLMIEPDLLKAMDKLDRVYGTTSNYSKAAHNLFDYINNPNNESGLLRSYAFHWFLGYNFSSATINLTQTIQGTVPILSSITGVTKGTGGVLKAGKDSIKLYKHMLASTETDTPRLGKYGFEFHTTELRLNEDTGQMEPYSKLDEKRKPAWMDSNIKTEELEKSGEFGMLGGLFKKGTIQPIQNMDLGAGELSKLVKSNSTRFLTDSSGYAFGMIENVNRITAALAFYRAAKTTAGGQNAELKARFKAYARSTRFGELDLDAMDDETFARTMAEMGVEKTQFFMGKENRPWMFQGRIMSVVSQFQSFMWQMVGLYADALTKSMGGRLQNFTPEDQVLIKSMARKQLGMMALTIMVFGGAMGLPFMENFKQLWRMITQNFGDEVGEDFEQGTREVLGPLLGYNATDMMLRGLVRGLKIDISRRASYGDILPLRVFMGGDPVDYTGPAISRMVDTVEGINSAYDRGDVFGTIVAGLPIAAGNLWRASGAESNYGTFTQRGQQLLPAGSLGIGEKVIYGLGFNPLSISRARSRRGAENYYQYRAANGKEYYTARMATWMSGYMGDMKKGNLSSAQNNLQKYYEDYLKVMKHDMDNMATPSKQYNINIESVYKRALRAHDAMGLTTGPRVRKSVRPEIQRRIMEGAIAAN